MHTVHNLNSQNSTSYDMNVSGTRRYSAVRLRKLDAECIIYLVFMCPHPESLLPFKLNSYTRYHVREVLPSLSGLLDKP